MNQLNRLTLVINSNNSPSKMIFYYPKKIKREEFLENW